MTLIPRNPEQVMVINEVVKKQITTLSVPFWRASTIPIGGRATLVRMTTGQLAVFSPVALTPTVKSLIADWGPVGYIIAPDIEHHIFLGEWHEEYPNAQVIGPEGLFEKREAAGREKVPFSHVFTRENKRTLSIGREFDADFEYEYVDVHPNKELVFNFKPEKTLIEADLIFNMPATEQFKKQGEGFLSRWLAPWGSAFGEARLQKNMIWHVFSRGGNPHFNDSMRRIQKWDFDRIIPCHGDVIESGGKEVFDRLMDANLKGKTAEGPAENL